MGLPPFFLAFRYFTVSSLRRIFLSPEKRICNARLTLITPARVMRAATVPAQPHGEVWIASVADA